MNLHNWGCLKSVNIQQNYAISVEMFCHNKLAIVDSKTNAEAAVEFDQVSVCSSTGCTCFGSTTNLFSLSHSRPVERKMSDAGNFNAKRISGGRWVTQINVHEAKSWRNWRRPSSTSSSRHSGSRFLASPSASIPFSAVGRSFSSCHSK